MVNKELKPCPFCGSTNINCADAGHKTDVWFIQCDDCGATFPHFDSEQEAVDAWNKRTDIKHGEWLMEFEPNMNLYCFHCSVCDNDFSRIDRVTKTNYCPDCGAKMNTQ